MKQCLLVVVAMIALVTGEVDQELEARYLKMEPDDFIKTFNDLNLPWKIKKYNDINVNLIVHYSTHEHNTIDFPVQHHQLHLQLPDRFDARKQWPNCPTIREIYNQYDCGSCWTHGVANTASDRICIHTNKTVVLSEQDLECSHMHQTICYGGYASQGFKFWRDYGLVTRKCKPYEPLDLNRNDCIRTCQYNPSLKDYLKEKHSARSVYSIPNDDYQIKAELCVNGPIQAMMPIYEDFKNEHGHGYSSGIYVHTYGKFVGYHSVRVIGYGVENGVHYWLVANSWGKQWGENGLFRIKRFQSDLYSAGIGFETHLITGLPMNKD